jgi:hypothetical protein
MSNTDTFDAQAFLRRDPNAVVYHVGGDELRRVPARAWIHRDLDSALLAADEFERQTGRTAIISVAIATDSSLDGDRTRASLPSAQMPEQIRGAYRQVAHLQRQLSGRSAEAHEAFETLSSVG